MAMRDDGRSAKVEVVRAGPEDQPVLANLLELYIHDFSGLLVLPLGDDGRFGYQSLPLYWREAERHPFLIHVNGNLAGFALVKKGSEVTADAGVWDMTEFFVVRGYRRRGVGTMAAHRVFRKLIGGWQIRVMEANQVACQFWERTIGTFTGCDISFAAVQRGGKRWRVYSFDSAAAAFE